MKFRLLLPALFGYIYAQNTVTGTVKTESVSSVSTSRPASITSSLSRSQQPPVASQPNNGQQAPYNYPPSSPYGPPPFGRPPYPPPPFPPFGPPFGPPPFMPRFCNDSTVSCHWDQPVDSCCSPGFGLISLSQQFNVSYSPANNFTIQHFKPTGCGGEATPPNGCDQSRVSNQIGEIIKSSNSTLYDLLNTFWPSHNSTNNELWSNEWIQYGTCISTLHPRCYGQAYRQYQDVSAYFETAINLSFKYNISHTLNAGGIKPKQIYKIGAMRTTLERAFKAKVQLDCDSISLKSVSIYFHVIGRDNYTLTNTSSPGTCKDDQKVHY